MTAQIRFGTELRRLREEAGLSLGELAGRIHYSKGYLCKIERGEKPVNVALASLCDAALVAGGRLVRLAARHAATGPPIVDTAVGDVEGMWSMSLGPSGAAHFAPSRRQVLTAAVSVLGLSVTAGAPQADTSSAFTAFRNRFDETRNLGQMMSPAFVLPVVIAETHALRGLAAGAPPDERAALLRLASRYAEFAGWMSQEAGDDRMALWWTNAAVQMAAAGGDRDLEPYALVRRANIALYADDAVGTVDLARRAQLDPTASVRVRGLAALREAQGHALSGDHGACMRALDRSASHLGQAAAGPSAPVLGTTKNLDPTAMARGWCMFDLGRPAEAANILDQGINAFASNSCRARARQSARAALAYATAGELDRACEITESLLGDAEKVDSATIRHDIRRLCRTFARRQNKPAVHAVQSRLTALLHYPSP